VFFVKDGGDGMSHGSLEKILEDLQWRGLIHQTTGHDSLQELLKQPTSVYAGFDPTSDSLHVGSLLPLVLLRRFQQAGHRPIALVGGATGMVGDPSGKSEERNLLSKETLAKNVAGLQQQMRRFLDFEGAQAASLVNNFDWMKDFSFLDFLRDVGKNVPVNVMLTKDSVKQRLERQDGGLSFTEFSYMLLQAYDFAYLAKEHTCRLQIGGSDQWGNITAGIDLARRMHGISLHGLTCPLLLTSDGRKMGKTERGAVWLDSDKTSPYAFYQYFINVADDDVSRGLRFLTDLTQEEILELERCVKESPQERAAQKRLAENLTELVHGSHGLARARQATEVFFSGASIENFSDRELLDLFVDVPSAAFPQPMWETQSVSLIEGLCATGLAKSKGEARRSIEQGAIAINNRRVDQVDRMLGRSDLASESVAVIRSGKKRYALLKIESAREDAC
jgi:tyrosyl-tRNA synthetase